MASAKERKYEIQVPHFPHPYHVLADSMGIQVLRLWCADTDVTRTLATLTQTAKIKHIMQKQIPKHIENRVTSYIVRKKKAPISANTTTNATGHYIQSSRT